MSLADQQDERIALEGLISLAMSAATTEPPRPTQMDTVDLPDEVVEEGTQAFRKLREGFYSKTTNNPGYGQPYGHRHNSLPNIAFPHMPFHYRPVQMQMMPMSSTSSSSSAADDQEGQDLRAGGKISFKRERPYRTRRSVRDELDSALRFPVRTTSISGPSSPVSEHSASTTQSSTLLPSIHEALGPLSVMPPPLPPPLKVPRPDDIIDTNEQPLAKRTKVEPTSPAEIVEVPVATEGEGEINVSIDKPVMEALSTSGVTPESIVNLIVLNDKDTREAVLKETGFSTNYIMKLQRRVLHSSAELQLPTPVVHNFGPSGLNLHVLFDSRGTPLFMKKELCAILGMKGTTFSYWKKKSGVEDTDTSKDFRLMDVCRTLFGGRATYTLYSPQSTLTILAEMETSRQKNTFTNLPQLKYLVVTYANAYSGRRSSV
jgi:hypothetical protein